jgi:hypothetical protein
MNESELIKKFAQIDTSDFLDFNLCKKPFEKGLWVLWAANEKLGIKKLTAEQIATIIIDIKEESIDAKSITNSFNRAGDKIHTYKENEELSFGIMKPGKDHLLSLSKEGYTELFYFEPGKPYTSRKILSEKIFSGLKGDLRIVDPYCDIRTLDILEDIENIQIKFLTRIDNFQKESKKKKFLEYLKDFKKENSNVEFKDYPHIDIHDRYIISTDSLVILGHSIKDIGKKESFAIVLNKNKFETIFQALLENFNTRWEQSIILE